MIQRKVYKNAKLIWKQ